MSVLLWLWLCRETELGQEQRRGWLVLFDGLGYGLTGADYDNVNAR